MRYCAQRVIDSFPAKSVARLTKIVTRQMATTAVLSRVCRQVWVGSFGTQAPLSPSNWSALYRGRDSPVMSWVYFSRPTMHSRRQGWAIKDFSVLSEMWSICEQPLYCITLMILHTNNWCALISDKNLKNIFQVHLKTHQCFGTLAQPFHFLPNMPVMTQWILTGPTRIEWLWVNDFSHNEYHIWQAWPSTCWHVGDKLPKYEVPVLIAQTRNHWRKWKDCASVPKNGLPNWCD